MMQNDKDILSKIITFQSEFYKLFFANTIMINNFKKYHIQQK